MNNNNNKKIKKHLRDILLSSLVTTALVGGYLGKYMPEGSYGHTLYDWSHGQTSYIVKKGDTLTKIVKEKYQKIESEKDLISKINEISDKNNFGEETDTLYMNSNGQIQYGSDKIKGDTLKPGMVLHLPLF